MKYVIRGGIMNSIVEREVCVFNTAAILVCMIKSCLAGTTEDEQPE